MTEHRQYRISGAFSEALTERDQVFIAQLRELGAKVLSEVHDSVTIDIEHLSVKKQIEVEKAIRDHTTRTAPPVTPRDVTWRAARLLNALLTVDDWNELLQEVNPASPGYNPEKFAKELFFAMADPSYWHPNKELSR